MPNYTCTTCGTQYAESDQPPAVCAVCQDERQYVKATGQHWITLDKLRLTNRNSLRFEEPGLIGLGIDPHFAIGQRALFLRTAKANLLWDYLPLLDEAVVEAIKGLGGISAIAISHPHYYSGMVDWSRAFGGVPVYLHPADRPGGGVPGPLRLGLLRPLRRSLSGGGVGPGALPALGKVPGGGLRCDERGVPRRRSCGGDAVVVVRIRGARGSGVGGADVLPGPPRS